MEKLKIKDLLEQRVIEYNFVAVPTEIYAELKPRALKLYVHLLNMCPFYESQGKVYHPSIKQLEKELKMNHKAVMGAKDDLEQLELIIVFAGCFDGQTANEYHINWDMIPIIDRTPKGNDAVPQKGTGPYPKGEYNKEYKIN